MFFTLWDFWSRNEAVSDSWNSIWSRIPYRRIYGFPWLLGGYGILPYRKDRRAGRKTELHLWGAGNSPYGKKIKVTAENGKEVKLLLYDKIQTHAQEKSKMVKGEKYRTVYHYLKFSKVVVDIEYIRIRSQK